MSMVGVDGMVHVVGRLLLNNVDLLLVLVPTTSMATLVERAVAA